MLNVREQSISQEPQEEQKWLNVEEKNQYTACPWRRVQLLDTETHSGDIRHIFQQCPQDTEICATMYLDLRSAQPYKSVHDSALGQVTPTEM